MQDNLFDVRPQVDFRLVDLDLCSHEQLAQAAEVLQRAFVEVAPHAWPDLVSAMEEVNQVRRGFARAAIDTHGRVIGWIGAEAQYEDHVWEIHPLAVDPNVQGAGIGRALLGDLEAHARRAGVSTITAGCDDHGDFSNVGTIRAEQVAEALATVEAKRPHPLGFYRRMGYAVVGLIPNANGPGQPDIFVAKSL